MSFWALRQVCPSSSISSKSGQSAKEPNTVVHQGCRAGRSDRRKSCFSWASSVSIALIRLSRGVVISVSCSVVMRFCLREDDQIITQPPGTGIAFQDNDDIAFYKSCHASSSSGVSQSFASADSLKRHVSSEVCKYCAFKDCKKLKTSPSRISGICSIS